MGPLSLTVDLYRVTKGRHVYPDHRVAHFPKRTKDFTFAAKGKRYGDGIYFARFTLKAKRINDVRRVALVRRKGVFHARPAFYAQSRCVLLRSAKLHHAAWGGSNRIALGVYFSLRKAGAATVTIRKGAKVVRKQAYPKARTTAHRLSLASGKLARGDYRVTIAARSGKTRETVTLTAKKI